MGNAPFVHVLSVAGVISVLSECQPPSEPEVREVQVALRAGGRKAELLDLEVEGWKKNSTIRPSLPQDLAQGGYSEFMQEMLASWHDFMSYTPDRDDRFEEGERKSRGNGEISWKQRLKQLASVVHLGLRKHEIMDMYGGHDLFPAVAGTYWLHKTDFERLPLSKELHLFQEIWKIVGRSLLPSIQKCQVKRPCACHFVACNLAAGEGELSALELRSTSFEWPKLSTNLPTTAAPGVKYLALEGKDAFKHPEFWLQAFPAIKVLQLFVPSYHIENVAILLQGWRENLLGFSLHWNPELEILHQDPLEVPNVLWESICSLKKLRRYITRLPECLGQLPLLELDVRGSQFRDDMAMPEGLKWLGKTLVSFIAYSQGLDRRCNQPPPRHWNHTSLESFSFLSRCRPRPSWDAAEPIDALDDEEEWAWQCPWEAWVSRLDHHKAPWWSWHQIERFWVDANFLHGSFPATLAEAWPKMRSLDLQLNELSGPLPAALSKLQNLTALRVHRNNFSGPVAAVLFEAPSLQYTNFEGNSGLSGCIPVRKADEENKHLLDIPIQGTKITGLCQGKRGKDRAEL